MRTIVIKKRSDLQALKNELLASGLSAGRSSAAVEALAALNSHVKLDDLPAGAVLLVPDSPDFKRSASKSVAGETLDDFEKLVKSALEATAARLKQGQDKRTSERADLGAALKSTPVKRAIEADPQLKSQVDDAGKRIEQDKEDDARADKTLQAAMKAVQAELAALAKVLG